MMDKLSDVQLVVTGNNRFALELYDQLRQSDGNLFFSPYSIATALAMAFAGSQGNTAVQMANTLHFTLEPAQLHTAFANIAAALSRSSDDGNQLNIANGLWSQKDKPFLDSFITILQEQYKVSITPVDFVNDANAVRLMINDWVEEQTAEKIKDLLKPGALHVLTRLVLVNAIYFKGTWAQQFEQKDTHNAPFWISPEESIEVAMMTQKDHFGYFADQAVQVLERPYRGGQLSMILLLPRRKDGLTELEQGLTQAALTRWMQRLRPAEVELFLPKFEINTGFKLAETLQALGLEDAFIDGKANFAGIDGREGWLYIDNVIHQAFVKVDEEGTEAAAATAVVFALSSIPSPTPIFRADHPFLFLIRENNTGSILFIGRVAQPNPIES